MPQLNFNALVPEGPQGIFQGFMQGREMQNRLAQQEQQRQLADVQLRNALRQEQEALTEAEVTKRAGSVADLPRLYREAGLTKRAFEAEALAAKQRSEQMAAAKAKLDLVKTAANQVFANPQSAPQILQAFGQKYGVDMSDDLAEIQRLGNNPDAIRQWAAGQVLQADKLLPKTETRNLGGTLEEFRRDPLTGAIIGTPTVLQKTPEPGAVLSAETARRGQDISAETARRGQDLVNARALENIRLEGQRLGYEGRRLAMEETRRAQEADPVFQQRMAAAKATGEAAAKGDVAAQRALPTVISRAEQGLRLIDELVGKQPTRDKNGKVIEPGTAPHAGFETAVGTTWLPGARFVPGTDAADFTARFDQLKGASFLEAFESLKGGGAITEKEGAKATDAINRMSLAQSEKEFIAAARDLQEVIRKGVTNAQRKVAAPAAAPAGNVRFLGFE